MARHLPDAMTRGHLPFDIEIGLNLSSFQDIIRRVSTEITLSASQGATHEQWKDNQALGVVEEAGEFIGEYRRLKGFARRPGDYPHMLEELSDVVISAMIMFDILHEDAEEHVRAKLLKIVSRGYVNKDEAAE